MKNDEEYVKLNNESEKKLLEYLMERINNKINILRGEISEYNNFLLSAKLSEKSDNMKEQIIDEYQMYQKYKIYFYELFVKEINLIWSWLDYHTVDAIIRNAK
jgi:hypothetical protein